ncbi:glycosyltransferase family 2 protein [Endozoicomonas sp. ALB032]|uniref:glycosyltransferase family 2 protein n=1 Tax=Endozoicomonas sp. ALB032 TaxID=3403082 RepID=UPI003BB4C230
MKTISYCIPVMNRSDDLKATLPHNISIIKSFSEQTELVVNCFDSDDVLFNWISNKFNQEIAQGLLKLNKRPTLPFWHFCWAKNSFKGFLGSKYYASLDGDNYLTEEEVSESLKLCQDKKHEYLIHLFTGQWGDGTSGRVIVSNKHYKKYGYISELYPRQFDEMALILNVLENENIIFVTKPNVNIFELSGYAKHFKSVSLLKKIEIKEVDFGSIIPPLLPRGEGYAEKDPKLNIYQNINAYYSMYKISNNDKAKKEFHFKLQQEQEKTFQLDNLHELGRIAFFLTSSGYPELSNVPTVYSVIKDDFQYLNAWYRHYKSMGIKRFIIVDDQSSSEISKELPFDDVFVFKPRIGNFKLFKVHWIKILCSLYQNENSWILTIDSDEFLDLKSSGFSNVNELIDNLENKDLLYSGGILIEMLPSGKTEITDENFLSKMNHHFWRSATEKYNYQNIPSIKWGFSHNWAKSFEFDFRYRFYGTIDSLRKFPVLKFNKKVKFNQGFHALGYADYQFTSEDFFENKNIIIPIKHYKFQKILKSDRLKGSNLPAFDSYFGRTAENIKSIINSKTEYTINLFYVSIHKRKYSGRAIFKRLNDFVED